MAQQQFEAVLKFDIKSTDPEQQTIVAVRQILKLSADLQIAIEKKYPGIKVKIRREEGVPVPALIHHILLSLDLHAIESGAEKAVSGFVTSEFLKLAKKAVRNLFASPTTSPLTPEKNPPGKRVSAKKPTSKKSEPPAKRSSTTSKTVSGESLELSKRQRG